MPWQLTTPVSTGDIDTVSYGEITITEFRFSNQREMIIINMEYGNTVGGEWVGGITPVGKQATHILVDTSFTNIVANATPNVGETTYEAVKRALFEQLNTDGVIAAGTVV